MKKMVMSIALCTTASGAFAQQESVSLSLKQKNKTI